MGARGPKSAKSLETSTGNVVSIDRPRPPKSLLPDEVEEWKRIVNAHPAETFTAGRDSLLASFCRQVAAERREAAILNEILSADDFDETAYERCSKRIERASRSISSLSVRLGFAYSTSYDKRKPAKTGKKPWEFKG